MKYLIELLHTLPKAAAIIEVDQQILECNAQFVELFGDGKGCNLVDFLTASGPHRDKLKNLISGTTPGFKGDEIVLRREPRPMLYWCEIHSTYSGGRLVHVFEVINVENFHVLEISYLQQLRRVSGDNLWVYSDDGTLIWFKIINEGYEKFLGRDGRYLVTEESWPQWDKAMAKARRTPGTVASMVVVSSTDGLTRYVDVCYLPGLIVGGRYYMTSRLANPSGNPVMDRLKDAWATQSDEELAGYLNTTKKDIVKTVNESDVPPDWLIKTGQLTGVSIDWLLTGHGDKRRF